MIYKQSTTSGISLARHESLLLLLEPVLDSCCRAAWRRMTFWCVMKTIRWLPRCSYSYYFFFYYYYYNCSESTWRLTTVTGPIHSKISSNHIHHLIIPHHTGQPTLSTSVNSSMASYSGHLEFEEHSTKHRSIWFVIRIQCQTSSKQVALRCCSNYPICEIVWVYLCQLNFNLTLKASNTIWHQGTNVNGRDAKVKQSWPQKNHRLLGSGNMNQSLTFSEKGLPFDLKQP